MSYRILKLIFVNVINIRKNKGESMNLQKAIDRWRDQETYKKQSGIHWFVWLLENPKSPISLTGAIDLYHHDIIHILLNRGMEVKDEAVVIGFTMGNSETTKPWVKWLFAFCVRYLYPEGYRFTPNDLAEYEMGYAYGLSLEKKNIHLACFDVSQDVRTIRNIWGINIGKVL